MSVSGKHDRPKPRLCVFLLQLGAPDSIAAIEPFLRNLFADVLPVPRLVRGPLARLIARRRAPAVAPLYEKLGGGSPLRSNTAAQAAALEQELKAQGLPARVLVVMRYAPPRAEAALGEARRDWSDARWVALPLYPQYSYSTTRSSLDELTALMTTPEQERLLTVRGYPTDELYLEAMTECVREALAEVPPHLADETELIFSAHSLPLSMVRQGDPYPEHVQQTMAGILNRLAGKLPARLCYQSRVGPVRWLRPSTVETIRAVGQAGRKSVVVVPIAFVSEHLETLHELDVELRELARTCGIESFVRARTPGTRPTFIAALAHQVLRVLPHDTHGG